MDPQSRTLLGQIVKPTGTPSPDPAAPVAPTWMTIEQIIRPTGRYAGPERRAQAPLVAEVEPAPVPPADLPPLP